MKRYLLVLSLLAGIACSHQLSAKENEENLNSELPAQTNERMIKTYIIRAVYQGPHAIYKTNYPELFEWSQESYCYQPPEHYPYYLYQGDVVDGQLMAEVYKKDGSSFEIPVKVPLRDRDTMFKEPITAIISNVVIPYSGEEIRVEVRRVNKEKGQNVLLFKQELEDLTKKDWASLEGGNINQIEEEKSRDMLTNVFPPLPEFVESTQCHISGGMM